MYFTLGAAELMPFHTEWRTKYIPSVQLVDYQCAKIRCYNESIRLAYVILSMRMTLRGKAVRKSAYCVLLLRVADSMLLRC